MVEIEAQLDRLDDAAALIGAPESPGRVMESVQLALDLLERGREGDIPLARRIVEAVIGLQRQHPPGELGLLPMVYPPNYGDLNSNLFLMPRILKLTKHHQKLGGDLAERLEHAIELAALMVERRWDTEIFDPHRDFVRYSNIFLLYIQAMLLAGQHMNDQRLIDKAGSQWKRWFHHTSYLGIDEFVSPSYANVDFEALATIHDRAPDDQMRREASSALDQLVSVMHAVDHPTLGLAVSGSSRNYRLFLKPGRDAPSWIGTRQTGEYRPPEQVIDEHQRRKFPHQARGRATDVPFRFATWQQSHAGLGTMTGGQYFWQHMHCIAAVGTSPEQRATAFLPGSYCPVAGFSDQVGPEAMCVFTRRPNPLFRTQRPISDQQVIEQTDIFGLGISDGWTIEKREPGIVELIAFEHRLSVRPFVIGDAGDVQPILLEPVERDEMSWRGGHRTAVRFTELMFPRDALWFGAHVALSSLHDPAPALAGPIEHDFSDRVRVFSAGPCRVRLFEQPAGETIQLHDDDWQATALLESPAVTIWPGDALRPGIEV